MKILLTGSHGYIGAVTGRVLVDAGHEVTGLDSYLYAGCDLGPDDPAHAAIPKDVRDVDASELGWYDAIVHLAALSNDPIGELSPDLTRAINLDATVRLAQSAKEAGVGRFVFASSCSMYGASDTEELVDESAPLRPLTAYAESKVRAEEALAQLADDDFSPVFMRNATAYGVSPRLRLDIVLNNLAAWGVTTGAIKIMSDGTPWRPLVHVEDIALRDACRCSRHRATSSTPSRSTSAGRTRTTRCASWPRSCGRRSGIARSSTPAPATRTRAPTASRSRSWRARCPTSSSPGRRAAAPARSSTRSASTT